MENKKLVLVGNLNMLKELVDKYGKHAKVKDIIALAKGV